MIEKLNLGIRTYTGHAAEMMEQVTAQLAKNKQREDANKEQLLQIESVNLMTKY
jgi:hypothetical protein